MSHTTVSATRDYVNGSSKGDLIDPTNKSFDSDPMLPNIKTSQLPHKILPDPAPSTDPELFDKSTAHQNKNYHHEKQLSKKKRAKKFGTVSASAIRGGNKVGNALSDKQHSKDKIDHEKRRDLTFEERDLMANKEHPKEGEDEEDEEDLDEGEEESEDEQEITQSAQQNAENRLVGREHVKGLGVTEKHPAHPERAVQGESKPRRKSSASKENEAVDESMEKGAASSLLARASNLASSLTSKMTETLTAAKEKIVGKSGDDQGEGEQQEKSSDDKTGEAEGEKNSQ